MKLHLRDLSHRLVSAWRDEFGNLPDVEISHGDIFSTREGILGPDAPIDVTADAVVSPANSFGFMDGGIDAVYTYQLGPQVQRNLQDVLKRDFAGELPVGQAVIVPTEHPQIPWCVSAPTMRIPGDVSNTLNAYLAFRATLLALAEHNRSSKKPIRHVLCPGLASAVGGMPPERCARQMRRAWDRVVLGQTFVPRSLREASADELELLR